MLTSGFLLGTLYSCSMFLTFLIDQVNKMMLTNTEMSGRIVINHTTKDNCFRNFEKNIAFNGKTGNTKKSEKHAFFLHFIHQILCPPEKQKK